MHGLRGELPADAPHPPCSDGGGAAGRSGRSVATVPGRSPVRRLTPTPRDDVTHAQYLAATLRPHESGPRPGADRTSTSRWEMRDGTGHSYRSIGAWSTAEL